jgi:hypothetical protein
MRQITEIVHELVDPLKNKTDINSIKKRPSYAQEYTPHHRY